MELDDLKYQLNHKLGSEQSGRSDADIAALLNKRTISITDRLQKNLWFEIVFGILGILILGYLGFAISIYSFRIYFLVFTIVITPFLFVLFYLSRRIKELSATTLPVKSNLQMIVKLTEEFTRRYFQFTMALVPVCFVFAVLAGYHERSVSAGNHLFTALWQVFLVAGVYMAILMVGMYYFTKFYLKKLYGKYVEQLKACILELGE